MIPPFGTSIINQALKDLKQGEDENQKIARQESNAYFDQKINALQSQVKLLKEQASKIGFMGIFSAVTSIFGSLVSFAGSLFETLKISMGKIAPLVLKGIQTTLQSFKDVLQGLHDKDMKEIDAKIKERDITAEVNGKFYSDLHDEEMDAKKRGSEALQTLKDANREILNSYESNIKM